MQKPLPVVIVFHLNQSKCQWQHTVIGITCYRNQQGALVLSGQERAINCDDRSAMFESPHTLLERPKGTAKYSNSSSFMNRCLVPMRLDHMNHARVCRGHG